MNMFHQRQWMQGVCEPRLQRRHQDEMMSSAEDEIRGAGAIQLCGVASRARSVRREAEADNRGLVEKGCEVPVSGY